MRAHSISSLSGSSKGSVLALCLWVICFLSFLAVTLSYQVRQRLSLVKRLDERDKLHLLADAALKRSAAVIKKEPPDGYDYLQEGWSDNPLIFKDLSLDIFITSKVRPVKLLSKRKKGHETEFN